MAEITYQSGKGDAPRSCFSKEFRDNYDGIDWGVRVGEISKEQVEEANEHAARFMNSAFGDKFEAAK